MVQGCSRLKCNARMFWNILERSTCIETCRESLQFEDLIDHKQRWKVFNKAILPCLKSLSMRIQNRMKAAYDKFHKVEDVQLDTGTIVYLQKPKKDSKYANPFTGPYLD
eukprot:Nk52_evm1s1827 gene=Nk52_evmTU1s1827